MSHYKQSTITVKAFRSQCNLINRLYDSPYCKSLIIKIKLKCVRINNKFSTKSVSTKMIVTSYYTPVQHK